MGRLWATPVLALTWVIPVALTSGTDPGIVVPAFVGGLVTATVGVGIRMLVELAKPVTARA